MKPSNATAQARALHAEYQARTGYALTYNFAREASWAQWMQWSGWTWGEKELARVIGYLKEEIRREKRNPGALKFSNLIGDPGRFEEDLQLAKESSRRHGFDRHVRHPKDAQEKADGLTPAQRAARFRDLLNKPETNP